VQVSLRANIKKALTETGLPLMVRPWLMQNAGIDGQTGEAVIILEYDVADDGLVATVRSGVAPEKNP
jgi:hypothetical protein